MIVCFCFFSTVFNFTLRFHWNGLISLDISALVLCAQCAFVYVPHCLHVLALVQKAFIIDNHVYI